MSIIIMLKKASIAMVITPMTEVVVIILMSCDATLMLGMSILPSWAAHVRPCCHISASTPHRILHHQCNVQCTPYVYHTLYITYCTASYTLYTLHKTLPYHYTQCTGYTIYIKHSQQAALAQHRLSLNVVISNF